MGRDKWPSTVYDYEHGVVADEEVEELDLAAGAWLHCRCCDRRLRTKGAFSVTVWSSHKQCATHRKNAAEDSAQQTPEEAAYADFASAMIDSIEKDTEHSMLYRAEDDTREQVQAKKVVRKMALLVAEQQEELEDLRDEVDDLKDTVQELYDTIQEMRRQDRVPQAGRLHQKRRLSYGTECLPPWRRTSLLQRDQREGLEVIDMFGDEVQ